MTKTALYFESRAFGPDAAGPESIDYFEAVSDAAAKARVGRLAVKTRGPVDLARQGPAPWNERYLTTATPSPYHAKGYAFGRLD